MKKKRVAADGVVKMKDVKTDCLKCKARAAIYHFKVCSTTRKIGGGGGGAYRPWGSGEVVWVLGMLS